MTVQACEFTGRPAQALCHFWAKRAVTRALQYFQFDLWEEFFQTLGITQRADIIIRPV